MRPGPWAEAPAVGQWLCGEPEETGPACRGAPDGSRSPEGAGREEKSARWFERGHIRGNARASRIILRAWSPS